MKLVIFLTAGVVTSVQSDEAITDALVVDQHGGDGPPDDLHAYRPERYLSPCAVQLVYDDLGNQQAERDQRRREEYEEMRYDGGDEQEQAPDPAYAADQRAERQAMAARPLGVG